MSAILNIVSVVAAFVFGTGIIYVLLDATVGKLKFLNSKFEWNGFQPKDFVFLFIGAFIILFFTSFVTPYH